ncbi:MAG: MBL fold metallo-hydrolase [Proteobacteria bacterium]|nr:MBL fold metallo-hydrolase [Pseudomonadota bacterium]
MIERFTLLPGAEVVGMEVDGVHRHAQFGVPPCIKLWFQRRLAPPTTFVLPHRFFHRGVVQVSLEFFLYHFLFAAGKAFGRLPDSERMVVIGTADQLARCRRSLQVSLFGFSDEEMRSWTGPDVASLTEDEIGFIRSCQLFLAPKRQGFDGCGNLPQAPSALIEAYARGRIDIDDVVEWRAFDDAGSAELFKGATVMHRGDGSFSVRAGDACAEVNVDFDDDQAPWLVTLPPSSEAVTSDVFKVLCLGADPGFELEHPTTGFAICINGLWAVVDAPLCASYLLARHGIDSADVRVVFETHGHEDHMGSGIHFMLECITSGRPYTYVAAEPVYRTCLVKVAAVLGVSEAEADAMLTGRQGEAQARARVLRVSPRSPVRMLGATWHFSWTVHPVPTTGFRIELEHDGRVHALSYSSDTTSTRGAMGIAAMKAAGFLAPEIDPFAPLLRGDEDIVFWEAGGTSGDPIHFDAREWDTMCRERGISPTVVFMHTHSLPPEMRNHALARPGMSWTLASFAPVPVPLFLKLVKSLQFFRVADEEYWLSMFTAQGRLERYYPGATIYQSGADDSWFVVLQGQAEVHIEPDGDLGLLESSALFGPLGDHEGQTFRVRARSHVDVWRLPGEVLREFIVSNGLSDFFSHLWDNVGWLRQNRLFFGFPNQVLTSLAQHAMRREYAAGETLMVEDDLGHEMFVVLEGELEIVSQRNGTSIRRGPGELVGEYAVLVPGAQRSATVRALGPVCVLVLTRENIHDIVAGQIPLHLRLVRILQDRALPLPPPPS